MCHADVTLCLFVYNQQNIRNRFEIFAQCDRGLNSALGLQNSYHSLNLSANTRRWCIDDLEALEFSVRIRPAKPRVS